MIGLVSLVSSVRPGRSLYRVGDEEVAPAEVEWASYVHGGRAVSRRDVLGSEAVDGGGGGDLDGVGLAESVHACMTWSEWSGCAAVRSKGGGTWEGGVLRGLTVGSFQEWR